MTMRNDFGAFILTHGRPNKVKTYDSLIKCGYSGDIFIVIDNEDEKAEEYKDRFGEKVLIFDKAKIASEYDQGDNSPDHRTIFYARNACFELAKEVGKRFFIELDDDYPIFAYKFNPDYDYQERNIKNLDGIFEAMIEYFERIDALTLAMAQNGDFIGGRGSGWASELLIRRKAMNTFICDTERPFSFYGRINEDVNTYVLLGGQGKLFFTIPNVAIHQETTQKTSGGMTEVYLDSGTYIKSFYSVMYNPSCVKIGLMGDKHKRLHHLVQWGYAVPKIMSPSYKYNE